MPTIRGQSYNRSVPSPREHYCFARSRTKHSEEVPSLQIQKLHGSNQRAHRNIEPLFDLVSLIDKRKNIDHAFTCHRIFGPGNVSHPLDSIHQLSSGNMNDLFYYDACHAPSSLDRSTRYSVNTYDSGSPVAQISGHGVFFSPGATPCVMPNSTRRLSRAGVDSISRRSVSGSVLRSRSVSGSSTSSSIADHLFYSQPVAMIAVVERSDLSTINIVDQSTNHVLGNWSLRQGKKNVWDFTIAKDIQEIVAPVNGDPGLNDKPVATLTFDSNGSPAVTLHVTSDYHLDDVVSQLRMDKRMARRHTIASSPHLSMPPGAATRSRWSITSLIRSPSNLHISKVTSDYKVGRPNAVYQYRARLVDVVLFSALCVVERTQMIEDESDREPRSSKSLKSRSVSRQSSPTKHEAPSELVKEKRRRVHDALLKVKRLLH